MSFEIGKILTKQKQYKKALRIFKKIIEIKPNDLSINFQIGKIYYELNDINKSISFFKKCNEIKPNIPYVLFNLALALQSTGKIEEAKNQYKKLISMYPKDIKSYYGLFMLNPKTIDSNYFQKLNHLIKDSNTGLFEKSLINFIFSKIKKEEGNLDEEIKLLDISHQQCYNSNFEYNNQSNFYYKNIISNYFNKYNFEGEFNSIKKLNNSEHIFIIGLPRSGSTLVETIISHNSKNIYSVGEFHAVNTSILNQIGREIFSKDFVKENYRPKINKKKFQESLIEKYNNFDEEIFLDKSLENFFNIDIILEFFPNAKFIHTFRNINDAIIGIYQTMLPELSWSHNIEDIINYIKIYQKVVNYFKNKYPKKIIDVDLGKLTIDPEKEVKDILNFCKISINDNFLNFDKNKKLFNKTNSFLQVRNKIKKYEDNKYKRYYDLLDNF